MWMCVFCLKRKFSMFHKLKKKNSNVETAALGTFTAWSKVMA